MSLQLEYQYMCTGDWADPEPGQCPCNGNGWNLSDLDTWHKCPYHYKGQRHPEDYPYEEEGEVAEEPIVVGDTTADDDDIPF